VIADDNQLGVFFVNGFKRHACDFQADVKLKDDVLKNQGPQKAHAHAEEINVAGKKRQMF
jgi:hypothetical protein